MSGGERANPFLEILQVRRNLILHVFLGVMLIAAAAAFLTLRYSASAAVALDSHSVLTESGAAGKSPVELAWASLSDKQILAIIRQFQLDSGMIRLRAQNKVFIYVRSHIRLHELDSGGSETPVVQISFTGTGPSTVTGVANAIAQSVARAATGPTQQSLAASPENISEELNKSRSTLQLLSQTHNPSIPENKLQEHVRTDAALQILRRETVAQLNALDQQTSLAASHARAPTYTARPADPAALELDRQIKQIQARLTQLRQRYTEEYPDVEEAEGTLAALKAKLNRLPVEKYRPQPSAQAENPVAAEIGITEERDRILARQRSLDQAIKNNEKDADPLRQRIDDAKTFTQDYVFEQQRYNALLKQQKQQQQQQSQGSEASGRPAPRFIVIQSATNATANGLAVKPLFWILSLLSALLLACLSAFIAEQFNPLAGTEVAPRSLHTN